MTVAAAAASRGSAARIAGGLSVVVLMAVVAPFGLVVMAASAPGQTVGGCAPDVKGHYTTKQMSQLWVSAGGPESQASIAGAVGMAESQGDPNVVNSIGATGLWQILLSAHPDITSAEAKDPMTATRYAVKLWQSEGWQPWEAYTNGLYRKYLEPGSVPAATCGVDGNPSQVGPLQGTWLAAIPGQPGESCDARIIPDVLAIVAAYHVRVTDCYAPTGHAADGEHPLGLATDLVPGTGGTWDDVDRLAAWAEPVQDHPRSPFRWVGYNGDDGHGRGNHLHLSWLHGPGRPASTVTVINQPGGSA